MMITYNLKHFFKDLGSLNKININHKWKSEIAKTYKIEIII